MGAGKMKKWQRILGNGLIVGLIAFFSSLSIQFPPTSQNIWAAFIAFVLAFLPQAKEIFEDDSEHDRTKLHLLGFIT